MMLRPTLTRKHVYVALFILLSIYTWVFLGRPFQLSSSLSWRARTSSPSGSSSLDVFDFHPFQPEAIQSVCAKTKWQPGLVFTCEESGGGVGNLRNSILNCVRYAIAAGGSLVMPKIVLRKSDDITKIWNKEKTGFDYIFDKAHFVRTLGEACPGLRIYDELDEVPNKVVFQEELDLLPETLVKEDVPRTGLPHPEDWPAMFHSWLSEHSAADPSLPTIVHLQRSYISYPIYSDGVMFALNFGRILEFRTDATALAVETLKQLANTYHMHLATTSPILEKAYFGVHLRTERDAEQGWPPGDWVYSRYSNQSMLYLSQAPRSNTSVIYVASGNTTEVAKFAVDAKDALGLAVTTKFDLLKGKALAQLESLAWDQQALVDYLVMLRASDFAGIPHSSFAWNIALKRHTYSKVKNHLDGPNMLSDEFSQIYGEPKAYPEYPACLWP